MVWVRRDLNDHLVPFPVMDRDTFHASKLDQVAPSPGAPPTWP